MHTGSAAQRSARDLGAAAYTVDEHIVFGSGGFAPGTVVGDRLLAHELAHVVQDRRNQAPRGRATVHRAPRRGKQEKPLDLDDPATRGRVFEQGEAEDWGQALEKRGYTVYINKRGDFAKSKLLRNAFRHKNQGPDLVAVNEKQKHILVGDITAGAWSTAELKPGDVRKMPNDLDLPESKPHLDKTVSDARQLARNLPDAYNEFTVTARDRYREDPRQQFSQEVTVRAPVPAKAPPRAAGAPAKAVPAAGAPAKAVPAKGAPASAVSSPPAAIASRTARRQGQPALSPPKVASTTSKGGRPGKGPGLRGSGVARGVRGRGLGLLISMAASLFASKAQAATDSERSHRDLADIERQVAAKLAALGESVATLQALAPARTVFVNYTVRATTFEMFIATPDGAVTEDIYMGTDLGDVAVSYADLSGARTERDGSAARGGTDSIEITTYSEPLEPMPVELLIEFAKLKGLDLNPLRQYVTAQALVEESTAANASVTSLSQGPRDRWVRALQQIDAP